LFSLNPKSYFAVDYDTQSIKSGAKGVQKTTQLTYEDYKNALYEGKKKMVSVCSIQGLDTQMCTVTREKVGLSNIFLKGHVADDQVTVRPFARFLKK